MVVDRVSELAENYSVSHAQISLAWLLYKKGVVSPVIGATNIAHLESAIKALKVQLTSDDMAHLEEMYAPHPLMGLIPYGSSS